MAKGTKKIIDKTSKGLEKSNLYSKENKKVNNNLKKEIDFRVITIIGFLSSLLLILFTYKYFGSYFEMNDDPRYIMAMKGFASPTPYNNFVSVYKFTSDLYIWLYKNYPNTGWYGYSMFLILWGSLFNIFICLYLAGRRRMHFIFTCIIFITFYFLIYFQNIYWINFTRPAIIGTFSFILLLGVLYLNIDILKKHKWVLLFPSITYVLAHITRLDGGYLGFIFGLTTVLLIISIFKNIFPFLLKYILPVFIFLLFIKAVDVYSQKNNERNNDFLEKTELIRQLIDFRNSTEYIPTSIIDTLSYNALINARYCNDDKVISKEYIKKLTGNSPLIVSGNSKKMKVELDVFFQGLNTDNMIARNLNISLLLILLIWFVLTGRQNLFIFLKYVSIQLLFICIILGMSYYMKLPARIFNPLLVVLTLTNLVFVISTLRFKNFSHYYLIFISIFSVFIAWPQYSKANMYNINAYEKYGRINQKIFNGMNEFSNTIFIPTVLRIWEAHKATDPIKEINFKNGNCYVYLAIELSLAPETTDQLIDKFGTSDHSELFKKISTMDNVIFVSSEEYNNFLRGYYHYLYNQDYYFEKVGNVDPLYFLNTGLNYYRLKKI